MEFAQGKDQNKKFKSVGHAGVISSDKLKEANLNICPTKKDNLEVVECQISLWMICTSRG